MRSGLELRAIALAVVLPAVIAGAVAHAAPDFAWRYVVGTIQAGVAVAGTAVLLWGWAVHRVGRPEAFARTRDGLLLALGLLAGLCWWNLGLFHRDHLGLYHRDHYIHEWDTYHYYVGAKYFPELGYVRLYLCTVVADAEAGRLDPNAPRMTRDLETNHLVKTLTLAADPERCIRHFSPARWEAFKRDLTWFRERIGRDRWPLAQRDHGFNATPVWVMFGRTLASTGPASSSQMLALALIDALLLVGMWAIAWWGFGWRATCVALLYWGTNYPAHWGWTGGGYLRQDWLLLSVVGLVLLRQRRMGAAGAALGVAGLLRIFPWVLVGGVGLKALWMVWEHRSFAPLAEYRRFTAGLALALLVLVPAASAATAGWAVWPAFVTNIAKHSSTPVVNNIGLKSLLSYDHDQRHVTMLARGQEYDMFWREARTRVFAQRRPVFLAAASILICVIAGAVRGQPDWVAVVLAAGLIPVLTELTCYYYSIFLAFGFIGSRCRPVGIGLVGLAAATWLSLRYEHDTRFAAISAAFLGFVVLAAACVWLSGRSNETDPPGSAPT